MKCENCGNTSFKGTACMQCGRSVVRVGPTPEPESRKPTLLERILKRQKAVGRELSPDEAERIRKELGID